MLHINIYFDLYLQILYHWNNLVRYYSILLLQLVNQLQLVAYHFAYKNKDHDFHMFPRMYIRCNHVQITVYSSYFNRKFGFITLNDNNFCPSLTYLTTIPSLSTLSFNVDLPFAFSTISGIVVAKSDNFIFVR